MSTQQIAAANQVAAQLEMAAQTLDTTAQAGKINWKAIFAILLQIIPIVAPLISDDKETPPAP
jgi:hypothetical protein